MRSVDAPMKDIGAVRRLERDVHARFGHDGIKVAYKRMFDRAGGWLCTSSAPAEHLTPKMIKHPFKPSTHRRKRHHRCGADVAWMHWRAGRRLGSYPLARCLSLNSPNGVLQHQALTVEVCFVKSTLAKLVRLRGACAIIDGAPVVKGIYL